MKDKADKMSQTKFYDHEVVQRSPDDYIEVILLTDKIINAWTLSIFAHELLNKNGDIKDHDQMNSDTLQKYIIALDSLKKSTEIAKPILGIGIMDNIEIGIGREIIIAAKKLSIDKIPVHLRKSQADDIQKLLG